MAAEAGCVLLGYDVGQTAAPGYSLVAICILSLSLPTKPLAGYEVSEVEWEFNLKLGFEGKCLKSVLSLCTQ